MLLILRTMQIQIVTLVRLMRPVWFIISSASLAGGTLTILGIESFVLVSFEHLILVKGSHGAVNLPMLTMILNCIFMQRFLILRMWPRLLINQLIAMFAYVDSLHVCFG